MPHALKRQLLFPISFIVASVATVTAIWTPDLLPLLDWPQHLALVSAIRHLGDPTWGFERYVVHEPKITTYMTFYYGAAWIARWLPVDQAGRVLLALYLVGTPAAIWYARRAFGRGPWPSLLAFVAVFAWPLYMGFAAYCLSIPFLFLAIGAYQRASIRGAGAVDVVVLCLSASLLFLTHALSWLAFGAVVCVTALPFFLRVPRVGVRVAASLLPSVALFAIWFWDHFIAPAENELGAGQTQVHATSVAGGDFGASFRPLRQKLEATATHFNEGFVGNGDHAIAEAWLWIVVALLIAGLVGGAIARGRGGAVRGPSGRATLVALVLAGLYFATPMEIAGIWAISPRMILIGSLGLLLALPDLPRRIEPLAYAPALALALSCTAYNADRFAEFDDEAAGLTETIDAAERGRRMYGLIYDASSRVTTQPVYLHAAAYYMVRRGGLTGFTFLHNPSVTLRLSNVAWAPYPGQRGEWEPFRWRFDLYGPFYDYLLTRGAPSPEIRIGARRDELVDVATSGRWQLHRNDSAADLEPLRSLRESIHQANVVQRQGEQQTPCAAWDGARFQCPRAEWVWVGPTEQDFRGRRVPCIWAHPFAGGTVAISFPSIPAAADRLLWFGGIADTGEPRPGPQGADVTLRWTLDGQPLEEVVVPGRRGYEIYDTPLPESRATSTTLTLEVSAEDDGRRHLCFGGTLFADSPHSDSTEEHRHPANDGSGERAP